MNFRSYDRNDQLQPLESHFTGVGRVRAVIGKETLNLQTNTLLWDWGSNWFSRSAIYIVWWWAFSCWCSNIIGLQEAVIAVGITCRQLDCLVFDVDTSLRVSENDSQHFKWGASRRTSDVLCLAFAGLVFSHLVALLYWNEQFCWPKPFLSDEQEVLNVLFQRYSWNVAGYEM